MWGDSTPSRKIQVRRQCGQGCVFGGSSHCSVEDALKGREIKTDTCGRQKWGWPAFIGVWPLRTPESLAWSEKAYVLRMFSYKKKDSPWLSAHTQVHSPGPIPRSSGLSRNHNILFSLHRGFSTPLYPFCRFLTAPSLPLTCSGKALHLHSLCFKP